MVGRAESDSTQDVHSIELRHDVDFFLWLGIHKYIYLIKSSHIGVVRHTWAY